MFRWLKKRFHRDPLDQNILVKIKISPLQEKIYKEDAYRKDINYTDWLQSALDKFVAKDTITTLQKRMGGNLPDIIPEQKALPPAKKLTVIPNKPKKVDGHPCYNLEDEMPARHTTLTCKGTCGSPDPRLKGRPCFWAPLVAKECPGFITKKVKTKNPNVKK